MSQATLPTRPVFNSNIDSILGRAKEEFRDMVFSIFLAAGWLEENITGIFNHMNTFAARGEDTRAIKYLQEKAEQAGVKEQLGETLAEFVNKEWLTAYGTEHGTLSIVEAQMKILNTGKLSVAVVYRALRESYEAMQMPLIGAVIAQMKIRALVEAVGLEGAVYETEMMKYLPEAHKLMELPEGTSSLQFPESPVLTRFIYQFFTKNHPLMTVEEVSALIDRANATGDSTASHETIYNELQKHNLTHQFLVEFDRY
jgi:hypothetical protein